LRSALLGTDQVTSILASVEVGRLARRADPDAPSRAASVLANVNSLPLDPAIVLEAIRLEPGRLRSLDAIHVASALSLGVRIASLCTYDVRMKQAAGGAGLRVLSPGSG